MAVKVYSTPLCPWCTMTKKYFDTKKIAYEDVDITKNREAALEMVARSGQRGVPVIEIDGNMIVGFDKEKIDRILL